MVWYSVFNMLKLRVGEEAFYKIHTYKIFELFKYIYMNIQQSS